MSDGMEKVLVNLITGQKGAGKTTLIRNLLSGGNDDRAVVVLNEAGEMAISGEKLRTRLCAVSVFDHGCVCCEGAEGFAERILELIEQFTPKRILIETSGHADPPRVMTALYQSEMLMRRIVLEPAICVVNATQFLDQLAEVGVRMVAQVRSSAVVLVNKVDACEQARVEAVRREIEKVNPRAWIQECTRGQVPAPVLFMRGGDTKSRADEAGYNCFQYEGSGKVLDRTRLEQLLKRLPRGLFRLQGFVNTEDGTYRLDYVTGQYDLEPAPAADPGPLVFVGRGLDQGRLLSLMDRCRVATAAA